MLTLDEMGDLASAGAAALASGELVVIKYVY
jgi:hypothetical protein